MKAISFASVAAAAAAVALLASPASARDQIRVVGSSTVFPYSQAVAEEYANATGAKAPVVESTGTGGGMKIFCGGIGPDHPDVTGASRAMKKSEWELCESNGVVDITELQIGFDGLSITISRNNTFDWDLTEAEIFAALAAEVEVDGEIKANPYKKWSEINPNLPDIDIVVFGPPPTSGTRDAFVELTMHDGCNAYPAIKALASSDKERWNTVCSRMRTDGPFIEAGENDNLIVQRLQQDANAMGIFGYSFLYENKDTLKAVKVDGVEPTFETIADNEYHIARPIFVYVKNAHRGVIPGMEEFITEYVSDAALGMGGYLSERGLTVMPEAMIKDMQERVQQSTKMSAPAS